MNEMYTLFYVIDFVAITLSFNVLSVTHTFENLFITYMKCRVQHHKTYMYLPAEDSLDNLDKTSKDRKKVVRTRKLYPSLRHRPSLKQWIIDG
jgi:hypothetical protein